MSQTPPKEDGAPEETVAEWSQWSQHILSTLARHETELSGLREFLVRIDKRQFVLWGVAGAVFAVSTWVASRYIVGALEAVSAPRGAITATITPQGRIDRLNDVWGLAGRHTAAGCPTVAELDRLAPELRGVDARERDYAGLLLGKTC